MIKKVKIIASTLVSSGLVLVANKASAENLYGNLNTSNNLDTYIASAVNFAIWAAALLSVVFIIIGGFQYITAGSSKDGATKAKNTLLYAIIGLVIVLLAVVIRNFVLGRVNVSINSM